MRWSTPKPARKPAGFIEPCVPVLVHAVPEGPEWAHEIKHDGYRFIVRRDGGTVRAFTRRGYDWTDRVQRIVAAAHALDVGSVTLDGEAVACDAAGVSDFHLLRGALARRSNDTFLYVFDVLEVDGTDLRPLQWEQRRRALANSCAVPPTASCCPSI